MSRSKSKPMTTEEVEALHEWLRNTFYGGLTLEEYAVKQAAAAVRQAVREAVIMQLREHRLEHLTEQLIGDLP
ncbi:hypothetical protein [Desulfovibrio aminophilus]|uniref:hypothetical protein n=1 Tax=Desulfovibrio aminophilus TaxID=81425 RepID=UPI0033953D6A